MVHGGERTASTCKESVCNRDALLSAGLQAACQKPSEGAGFYVLSRLQQDGGLGWDPPGHGWLCAEVFVCVDNNEGGESGEVGGCSFAACSRGKPD